MTAALNDDDDLLMKLVRGKKKDESKPTTFNKLWSIEEQTRLEELLHKFPAEEVEARRWEKIARGLGTRTPQQVCAYLILTAIFFQIKLKCTSF